MVPFPRPSSGCTNSGATPISVACGACHGSQQWSCSGSKLTVVQWSEVGCTGTVKSWQTDLNKCVISNEQTDAVYTCLAGGNGATDFVLAGGNGATDVVLPNSTGKAKNPLSAMV